MTGQIKRLMRHPRVRAILDSPTLFAAVRFPLIGRQTKTRGLLRHHLAAQPGERVLDISCGIGEFAGEVDAEYLGIDLNPRFIAAAARRCAHTTGKSFRVMDALRMNFPNKHFDRSMFVNGLHHFSDEDGRRLLAEVRRVTRERVVIIEPDSTPRGLLHRALLAADRGDWIRTPETLEQLIASVLPIRQTVRFVAGLYPEILYECGVG